MSTHRTHQPTVSIDGTPKHTNPTGDDNVNDPSLPPQRHAGAVGLGPNYPLGPSLSDKMGGLAEEIKGKVFGRPELVEHGHERRTGELLHKERERDNEDDPFKPARTH